MIRIPRSMRAFHSTAAQSSHVGASPISIPPSVSLNLDSPAAILVQGPLGQLNIPLFPFLRLEQTSIPSSDSNQINLSILDSTVKQQRAVWGLTRSLLANAVTGVSTGYTLSLRLVGVGYRATVEPVPSSALSSTNSLSTQRLNLKLGFAHPVLINLPSDVLASTPSTTTIELKGIDKQRLGEVAAGIRRWRVPEPYNVSKPISKKNEIDSFRREKEYS